MKKSREDKDRNNEQTALYNSLTFENDLQYLDEYSAIHVLLMKRLRLIEKMREWRSARRVDTDSYDSEELHLKITELTKVIEVKEWLFWEKVSRSVHEGRRFVIEDFSREFGLGHFEKRVFLVMLCEEINHDRYTTINRPMLINSLCLSGSLSERLKSAVYFHQDSVLFRRNILAPDTWRDGYRVEINLFNAITRKINGEAADWPGVAVVNDDNSIEKVGYMKQPEVELNSVILKEDARGRVKTFLLMHKNEALKELGVDKVIKHARGLSFLFYGPPGTGKSLLAEAVAKELNKKLLVVETPKIFNLFVGETDKNISAMFKTAHEKDLVLLIDEADSLLYARDIATSDFKVRFVNVMLTELERFEGVVVFTTNMDGLLDPAVERRVALKVKFDLPTVEMRRQMWIKHIPSAVGLSESVDFDKLAKQFEFSGGNIRNAVLNAVRYMAVNNQRSLNHDDLVSGALLELEGMYAQRNKGIIKGFSDNNR